MLHVRPALDLCDSEQVKLFKQISDEVAELTRKYGGLIWGEHGKGMQLAIRRKFLRPNYGVNYVTSNSYLIRKIASIRENLHTIKQRTRTLFHFIANASRLRPSNSRSNERRIYRCHEL